MKAVIFDFDGILFDTLQINFEINKETFKRYGIDLAEKEFIDIWVSPEGGKEGTKYFVKLKGINKDPAEVRAEKKILFEKYYRERAEPMPGALELVRSLRGQKIPIAIVSSNNIKYVELGLKKFGLLKDFDFIIASEDCKRHKPFPDPYLKAVERLGLEAKDVLVLEDTDTGAESAKKAGCKVIAVPNRFTKGGNFQYADLILKSLLEIDKEILRDF